MTEHNVEREVYNRAVELLARREHSSQELSAKLKVKFKQHASSTEVVKQVCERLMEQGYLSDERFATAFIRSRINRGFGKARILRELNQKGVDEALARNVLQELLPKELAKSNLEQTWQKKFGVKPSDQKETAKQMRFLLYRGFDMAEVREFIGSVE